MISRPAASCGRAHEPEGELMFTVITLSFGALLAQAIREQEVRINNRIDAINARGIALATYHRDQAAQIDREIAMVAMKTDPGSRRLLGFLARLREAEITMATGLETKPLNKLRTPSVRRVTPDR
jgi:hypothetical protein